MPKRARLWCQTWTMKAVEAITNLHTDDVERAREFFLLLRPTEGEMNQGGWPSSPPPDSGACVRFVAQDATAARRLGHDYQGR